MTHIQLPEGALFQLAEPGATPQGGDAEAGALFSATFEGEGQPKGQPPLLPKAVVKVPVQTVQQALVEFTVETPDAAQAVVPVVPETVEPNAPEIVLDVAAEPAPIDPGVSVETPEIPVAEGLDAVQAAPDAAEQPTLPPQRAEVPVTPQLPAADASQVTRDDPVVPAQVLTATATQATLTAPQQQPQVTLQPVQPVVQAETTAARPTPVAPVPVPEGVITSPASPSDRQHQPGIPEAPRSVPVAPTPAVDVKAPQPNQILPTEDRPDTPPVAATANVAPPVQSATPTVVTDTIPTKPAAPLPTANAPELPQGIRLDVRANARETPVGTPHPVAEPIEQIQAPLPPRSDAHTAIVPPQAQPMAPPLQQQIPVPSPTSAEPAMRVEQQPEPAVAPETVAPKTEIAPQVPVAGPQPSAPAPTAPPVAMAEAPPVSQIAPVDAPRTAVADIATVAKPAEVLPQTPIGPSIVAQVSNAISAGQSDQIELTLQPEELGKVRLTLSPSETSISVNINAERGDTADLIRRHLDQLSQDLRQQGYRDVRFDFGQGGGDRPGQQHVPQDRRDGAPHFAEPQSTTPAAPPRFTGQSGVDIRV